MKTTLLSLALFFPILTFAFNGTVTLNVGGTNRTLLFYSPGANAPSANSNLPLLIAMHGDNGSAANFKASTGFDAIASANNFIVAYPQGQSAGGSTTWNQYIDGTPGRPNLPSLLDDLPFLEALMDYFEQTYGINCNKIYATGHSAGGYMAYYAAVAFHDRIAAIAPYASHMWYDTNDPISNAYYNANFTATVPVFHIHGSSDGTVTTPSLSWPWPLMNYIQGAGCNPGNYINENAYPNLDGDNYFVNSYRYNFDFGNNICANPPYIHRLAIINSQGHGWPNQDLNEFNIEQEVWTFCNQFELNNVCQNVQPPELTIDEHIKIDQFGYLPNAPKFAIIANPITGYNNNQPFVPGTNTYAVRRVSDDQTVYTNNLTSWNNGNEHDQSGDVVWWFDFSAFTTPGDYYIWDSALNKRSYEFTIDECIYKNPLEQALHAYYYQRCGVTKQAPYAQNGYADNQCHLGNLQDANCRKYNDPNNALLSKNLSGGWHDAGDYNKYVNFTYQTLSDLLLAYEENPLVWQDNMNIPESGNGVPDLLDEAKYELDWLLKMQQSNGSVISVVGVQNYATASPPSADNAQRFYGEATTSASFSAAASFALAAIQFNSIGNIAYANTLETAAINAFTWATNNPNITFYNSGVIAAGENEVSNYERSARHLAAAVYLYALTNTASYKSYVDANYANMNLMQWGYAYPYEAALQDALLYYANLPTATASVKTAIRNTFNTSISSSTDNYLGNQNNLDAYRAYLKTDHYSWGSNQIKAMQANMYRSMIKYNLNTPNATGFDRAAADYVHYFHGVNPIGICYLSNMGAFGAEYSVREIYSSWFANGSPLWDRVGTSTYGPPPGFIPGGATHQYALDDCCSNTCASNPLCNANLVTPPLNQPVQKSYLEFNTGWPQNSWIVSEVGIYPQASYLRLLANYACTPCTFTPLISGEDNPCQGDTQTYAIPEQAAGTTYTWTVNGGTIVGGQNTATIQVQWSNGASGSIYLNVVTP